MQDVEAEVDEALSMQLCDIADRTHKTHQDIVHRLGERTSSRTWVYVC
jgi:hypothetical protein